MALAPNDAIRARAQTIAVLKRVPPWWNTAKQTFNIHELPEKLKGQLRKTFTKKDLHRRETAVGIFETLQDHGIGVYDEKPMISQISCEDYAADEPMPWEEAGIQPNEPEESERHRLSSVHNIGVPGWQHSRGASVARDQDSSSKPPSFENTIDPSAPDSLPMLRA